ncbi:leukocyte immunoglobulin-like receptor subfamily A member 2 [Rhinoderma darwinii]|uniref:leukocyte immunoglobulin-like receptor subfamily A member 2 n=1 Tax=Rhinoderma darwinii TaxID=43563 RepID=UPI003F66CC01
MAQGPIITPAISVNPNSSIPAGSNITIQCNGAIPGDIVLLYKNGKEFLQQQSIGSKADFILANISLTHRGHYFCMMQSNSRMSSHVKISVQDNARTFLSIEPTGSIFLGSNVTLLCHKTKRGETISLFKNGELYDQKTSNGSTVEFQFSKVTPEHEGRYFCREPSRYKISNEIYIWIEEGPIITPAISVNPNSSIPAGSNITIQCYGAIPGDIVLLYKNGKEFLRQQSIGSKADFILANISLTHRGHYFCMMQSNSRMSSHVKISVENNARTFLSIEPTGSIFLGSNVTLLCHKTKRGETISLFKNGELYDQKTSNGSTVEFQFSKVTPEHEGRYFCREPSRYKISNEIYVWIEGGIEEKQRDYSRGNMIRISVAGVILVVLIIVVSEYCYSMKKKKMEEIRCPHENEYKLNF